MNNFYIPWLWLALTLLFLIVSKRYKKFNTDNLLKKVNAISSIFIIFSTSIIVCIFIYLTYYFNYVRGTDIGVVKTASHEYMGYITYRPFTDTLTVYTIPKHPILTCPDFGENNQPMCKQELIKIKKDYVMNIDIF